MEGLDNEGNNGGVDRICMDEDTGGTRHPSIPVGEADGFGRASAIAGRVVAAFGTGGSFCRGEGGELCDECERVVAGGDGFPTRKYSHWATDVANSTDCSGVPVLAGALADDLCNCSDL